MIRVLGIGSPWGDDAVGWDVARAIAAENLDGVEVRILDRPGIGLVDHLMGIEAAILIDAMLAEGEVVPGRIVESDLSTQTQRLAGGTSTHGLGVFDAIEVARALGTMPPLCRLVAIAIAPPTPGTPSSSSAPSCEDLPNGALTRAVRAAIEPACEHTRRWVQAWQRGHLPTD